MLIVLMGIPGTGKTTLGKILAEDLGFVFYDIDDHMPTKYKLKMRNNQILSDEERDDYMFSIIQELKKISEKSSVVTALVIFREKDRKKIVELVNDTCLFKLVAPIEVLANRLKNRKNHFCSEEILRKTFEKEESILIEHFKIDVNRPIDVIIDDIKEKIAFDQ
jgi:gluconokinase